VKPVETVAELRAELKQVRTGVSGDTIFSAKAVLFIAERLVNIERALVKRNGKRKKPSAWNLFFADRMKAGKSPAEIGAEWRERRRQP
jgi:hypothetical protein